MSLTTAQLQALKAAMAADATVQALGTQDQKIADYYNGPSATLIWKSAVPVADLLAAVAWATDWNGLTVAKQNAWFALTQAPTIDATQANIRNGFAYVFSGLATTLNALTAAAQRSATVFEALFTTASVTSVYGYKLTDVDVAAARVS